MLHHIALTLNDSKEIEKFYEEVLLFNMHRKFSVNGEVTRPIFNVEGITDVYIMNHEDLQFEIFISLKKEKKVFSHVCLTYRNSETIYNNAKKSGYIALIKKGKGHSTYFIWDKSRNMFEIKDLQE